MNHFHGRQRPGRFLGSFGRGFGVYSTRLGYKLRAWAFFSLAMMACWLAMIPGYVGVVEPGFRLVATARWSAAALLDMVGLKTWPWSVDTDTGVQQWQSAYIRYEPWHLEQVEAVAASLGVGAVVATLVVIGLGVVLMVFLARKGRRASGSKVIRGRTTTSDKALARQLQRQDKDSELAIGRVPLVKSMEAFGTLLLGAQGAGKTSAIEQLLAGIQDRGEPVVVYDFGPGLMPRFFNARRGDIILNPLDARTASWSPWSEIETAGDCTAVAEGFIPENNPHDPFWGIAGRLLFAELLDRLRDDRERSVKQLLHVLLRMPQEEIREIVKGTNAVKLFQEGGERTGTSVEINTSVYVKSLGLLNADAGRPSDFSIQRFVEALDGPMPPEGRPWLWMPTDAKNAPILKPLITCWTNSVARSLLSLPERPDRRLWLVLDELATLQDMPSLPDFLHNGRKRGGCAILSLQSPHQLHGVYKDAVAETILTGCQTHAVFRISDAKGAAWAARALGDVELEEVRESARLGAHGRGGQDVHLSVDTRVSPVVMPTEINMLPNARCYVRLPEDQPLALTQVTPRPPLSGKEPTAAFMPWKDESHTAAAALRADDGSQKPKTTAKAAPTKRRDGAKSGTKAAGSPQDPVQPPAPKDGGEDKRSGAGKAPRQMQLFPGVSGNSQRAEAPDRTWHGD